MSRLSELNCRVIFIAKEGDTHIEFCGNGHAIRAGILTLIQTFADAEDRTIEDELEKMSEIVSKVPKNDEELQAMFDEFFNLKDDQE